MGDLQSVICHPPAAIRHPSSDQQRFDLVLQGLGKVIGCPFHQVVVVVLGMNAEVELGCGEGVVFDIGYDIFYGGGMITEGRAYLVPFAETGAVPGTAGIGDVKGLIMIDNKVRIAG